MKFTIRDLFWLVLAWALAFGWFLDRSRLAERIAVYETDLFPAGGNGSILDPPMQQ